MAIGDVIARLSVALDLNTSAFTKGSKSAQKEVETLGRKMNRIAGAIGTAFVASIGVDTVGALRDMSRAAVDSVGALGEQAQQLGVTTDALQEFRYAASQTGIEQAEIDKALQRLTRTIGELEEPTKAQAAAMEKLGLSTNALKGLGAGDALSVLADAFNKLPDAASRSAVGFDLMGRTFQTLLPLLAEGSKGIQQMIKDAREAGIILTEQEINAADKAADALSAIDQKVAARQQSLLARNAKMLVEFESMWGEFKIAGIQAAVDVIHAVEDIGSAIGWLFTRTVSLRAIGQAFVDFANMVGRTISGMVQGVQHWIGGVLDGVWASAKAGIDSVAAKFNWLYDAVIGHSYIPDMIDGIAAQMARLDTVMVAQAGKATTATAKKFQDLRDLLDRLFPEVGRNNQFNADVAQIENSGMSKVSQDEAIRRLWVELNGGPAGKSTPDLGEGTLTDGMDDVGDAIDKLTEKSKIGTVQIAKSFADMANDTLASLQRLTSAIKGGGFWDIVTSVLSLAIQLGSSGAFGGNVSGFLNKVPAHASGTNFHPGGLALVGERGPELVSMPRGTKVYPNGTGPGGGNVYHISGNLLTPEFWAMIQAGDMAAADAGAKGGVALGTYHQSRQWRR